MNDEQTLQSKIEKIAQAIYLVSNHLKDTEPLKWELRKESISFMSAGRSLGGGYEGKDIPPDLVIDALVSCSRDLSSYLSLAVVSGLVSRNNGNLISNEITVLMATFEQVIDENTAKAGFVLSKDFFSADPDLALHLGRKTYKGHSGNYISDNKNLEKGHLLNKGQKAVNDQKHTIGDVKDKKIDRQGRIIALLKNQTNLTIKDFVKVINDCSEKTIQRELIDLVDKGIVKREGERRWSTYSLK